MAKKILTSFMDGPYRSSFIYSKVHIICTYLLHTDPIIRTVALLKNLRPQESCVVSSRLQINALEHFKLQTLRVKKYLSFWYFWLFANKDLKISFITIKYYSECHSQTLTANNACTIISWWNLETFPACCVDKYSFICFFPIEQILTY